MISKFWPSLENVVLNLKKISTIFVSYTKSFLDFRFFLTGLRGWISPVRAPLKSVYPFTKNLYQCQKINKSKIVFAYNVLHVDISLTNVSG